MSVDVPHLIALVLAWLVYFVVHSLLASLAAKRWVHHHWPGLLPAYRLLFNAVALALLVLPLYLSFSAPAPWLWRWSGAGAWLANGLSVAAGLGFV